MKSIFVKYGILCLIVFFVAGLNGCDQKTLEDDGGDGDVENESGESSDLEIESGGDLDLDLENGLDMEAGEKKDIDKKEDGEIEREKDETLSDPDEESQEEAEPDWTHLLKPGEKRLSTIGLADGMEPHDINENYVVWCHGGSGRLFAYKISEGTTQEVSIEGVDHLCWWVTVDDNNVYTVASTGNPFHKKAVYQVDLQTGTHSIIDAGSEAYYLDRVFARDSKIALVHTPKGGASQIGLYNQTEDVYGLITDAPRIQEHPKIFDEYVVWSNMVGNLSVEIWLYNIETKESRSITPTEAGDQFYRFFPMMEENIIAWGKSNSTYDVGEIYLYDINTSLTSQLDTPGIANRPWMIDKRVFWDELDSSGTERVRLYDIEKDSYVGITDSGWHSSQSFPKSSGRWLTYIDNGRFPPPSNFAGGWDIVLFDLCTLDIYQNDPMCVDAY